MYIYIYKPPPRNTRSVSHHVVFLVIGSASSHALVGGCAAQLRELR